MKNTLWLQDSISAIKQIQKNSVSLVYLDPPFFTERSHESNSFDGNRISFSDIWKKGINEYLDFMKNIFTNSLQVLKKDGSIFVHCDWHASHYLKIELDKVFGYHNFRNEIIWKRHNSQNNAKQGTKLFGRMHDTIFVYSKTREYTWNQIYQPYSEDYVRRVYSKKDKNGELYALGDLSGPGGSSKGNPYFEFLGKKQYWRYNKQKIQQLYKEGEIIQTSPNTSPKIKRYLKNMKGVPLSDMWADITTDQTSRKKSVFYPTQKPLELLKRIIHCSTNIGDVVLDPFCGGGTSLISAHQTNRKWIGIDSNPKAIETVKNRFKEFGINDSEYQILNQDMKIPPFQVNEFLIKI